LYAHLRPDAPLSAMPILSDVITALEQFDEDEAAGLVRELRFFCYGRAKHQGVNLIGQSFNRHSTVDWNFSYDINYFDFSGVPELYRAFYYAQAIGAVNRYMRDPRRDVKRRTLLIIDEFGYATQVQAVAQMAAEVCKVARKYGIALMVIDQNPTTFLTNQAGLAIWENTRCKIFFHLDDKPARLVGETISDLTPSHVEFLSQARRGECVYMLDNDVYVMLVETNLRETRAFQGS
jgi:type IV secretory pathway VirB4 component